jgi:hypothetical protein
MIRSREEARRSSDIGSYHMRLVKAEGFHNSENKLSYSFRSSHVRTSFRSAKWRKIHGDDRTQCGEHLPGWKKGEDTFGQRAEKKNRIAVFPIVGSEANLESVDGLELGCV